MMTKKEMDYLEHRVEVLGTNPRSIQCPICGRWHDGFRYGHRDHWMYCSQDCFRRREDI